MGRENLIKKLKEIKIPEIELRSHKSSLRMALLSSDYFKKKNALLTFKKYLFFLTPALAVFIVLALTVIYPKVNQARALAMAKNNPDIKQMIQNNDMVLGDFKIRGGMAYVLLNPATATFLANTTSIPVVSVKNNNNNLIGNGEGALVELSLGNKKVVKINPLSGNSISPLNESEKVAAVGIASSELAATNIVPPGAQIGRVESSLPDNIHLAEKGSVISATTSSKGGDKRADVYYVLKNKEWMVRVNLNDKKVEEVQYSSD